MTFSSPGIISGLVAELLISAAQHGAMRHRQGAGAWIAIHVASPVAPLRAAVALAGAPDLAAEFEDEASSVTGVLEKLRSLPADQRRQLQERAQAAAEAIAALIWDQANLPGGNFVTLALTLHTVLLCLLMLVDVLHDGEQ